MSALPHPHQQPSLADLWNEFASVPGRLDDPGSAPSNPGVQHHRPVVQAPVLVATMPAEPFAWRLLRNLLQATFALAVVAFVVRGGTAPAVSLALVASGLAGMVMIALVDRRRFDATARIPVTIVEVVAPPGEPALEAAPRPPLLPLVEQMRVAMPDAVRVT